MDYEPKYFEGEAAALESRATTILILGVTAGIVLGGLCALLAYLWCSIKFESHAMEKGAWIMTFAGIIPAIVVYLIVSARAYALRLEAQKIRWMIQVESHLSWLPHIHAALVPASELNHPEAS